MERRERPPPRLKRMSSVHFAIVVRGPLGHFTSVVLSWYLDFRLGLALGQRGIGVVFSHNRGSCANTSFLQSLKDMHPHAFDWVLAEAPPRLGVGYRNAQREASHHGIALAVRRWQPEYLMVHRPDAVFQEADALPRLAALLATMPPRGLPPSRMRLIFGASQTVLSNFYGRFHLDDHIVFGRAADVADYWAVHNPGYCRQCSHSSQLPSSVVSFRKKCRLPGPESELGQLWVHWDHNKSRAPLPRSTAALIDERAIVINGAAFGHASMLHPLKQKLASRIRLRDLPLRPIAAFQHKVPGRSLRQREPSNVMVLCSLTAAGTYDCAGVKGSPKADQHGEDWPCADGEAGSSVTRHGGCPTHGMSPSTDRLLDLASHGMRSVETEIHF